MDLEGMNAFQFLNEIKHVIHSHLMHVDASISPADCVSL